MKPLRQMVFFASHVTPNRLWDTKAKGEKNYKVCLFRGNKCDLDYRDIQDWLGGFFPSCIFKKCLREFF